MWSVLLSNIWFCWFLQSMFLLSYLYQWCGFCWQRFKCRNLWPPEVDNIWAVFPLRILVLSQFAILEKFWCNVKTNRAQRAKRHDGVGSKGPLKGPGGVQGAEPPEAPGFSRFMRPKNGSHQALFLYNSYGEKCYKAVWYKNSKQVQLKDNKFAQHNEMQFKPPLFRIMRHQYHYFCIRFLIHFLFFSLIHHLIYLYIHQLFFFYLICITICVFFFLW